VATVLVQRGTLRKGDAVVVGSAFGKVRAMSDAASMQHKEAGPSSAVEITGLDQVPEAGDVLNVVESLDAAREVAEHRRAQSRTQDLAAGSTKVSLEDLMARMKSGESLELKVVLKADVKGSVEAVRDALNNLSTQEVKVNVVHGGVGAISESDILLASTTGGIVVGFNVRPDGEARGIAEREGVEIRTYKIIYEMLDDVRKAQEGLLAPETKENVVGHAEVRNIFRVSKVGTIAGCRVVDGKAMRAARVRVLRDSVQVYESKVGSLKHFKNDAREVESGLECGVSVEGFNDLKEGDVLEFFQVEVVARKLAAPVPGKRPGGAEAHP
jgi:translation initiation factor IF-2